MGKCNEGKEEGMSWVKKSWRWAKSCNFPRDSNCKTFPSEKRTFFRQVKIFGEQFAPRMSQRKCRSMPPASPTINPKVHGACG